MRTLNAEPIWPTQGWQTGGRRTVTERKRRWSRPIPTDKIIYSAVTKATEEMFSPQKHRIAETRSLPSLDKAPSSAVFFLIRGLSRRRLCAGGSIRVHSRSTSRVLYTCTIVVPYSRQDTSGFPADLDPCVRIRPAE